MEEIYFSKKEFENIWNRLKELGSASEGTTKKLNNKTAIKYFDGYDKRGHTKETILQFKGIKTKTYLFPNKVFYIDNELSGYISKYSAGKNLIEIERNKVVFDDIINASKIVQEDTKNISEKGILTCDILFNILYKKGEFNIIDTCEYEQVDLSSAKIYIQNISSFNYSLLEFLVKDRFYKFVFSSKELKENYIYVENGETIIIFLQLLKKRLEEYCDKEITTISSASKAFSLCHKSVYPEYF